MSEKLCTLRTKGGGGGKYTETSLWTNPSPTSEYSGGNVTLSDSLSNYKYIKIKTRTGTTNATTWSTIYLVDEFKTFAQNSTASGCGHIAMMNSSNARRSRGLVYVNDTTVNFKVAYEDGTATLNNTNVIPLEILGLNELAQGTKYTTNASEIAFKSVSANTVPTFTTVAEAKAIWLTINYASAYRALQITNVNPTTGEINNDSLYKIDTNSLGNIEPLTGNKFIVTSNSVTMQNAPSTAATQQSLIYTY